jgi:uncharacterized protein YecA (UPF0149 family)
MNTETGQIYASKQAALDAGARVGYVMEIDPTTKQRRVMKVGRNEPCPCGSGKKFKKCHLGQPA